MDEKWLVREVQTKGCVVLPQLIKGDDLQRIREEYARLLDQAGGPGRRVETDCETVVNIPPMAIDRAEFEWIRYAFRFCYGQMFRHVAKHVLDTHPLLDRILFHRSRPNDQAVTEWHADVQRENRLSFKVFIYLDDADERNGAFSYVPGSHSLVMQIHDRCLAAGIRISEEAHNYEQIRDLADRLGGPELRPLLKEMEEHIAGDYDSDDHYAQSGTAGSVLLFHTKGIHRGGVVRMGERNIIRAHYFQPPSTVTLRQRVQHWRRRRW